MLLFPAHLVVTLTTLGRIINVSSAAPFFMMSQSHTVHRGEGSSVLDNQPASHTVGSGQAELLCAAD